MISDLGFYLQYTMCVIGTKCQSGTHCWDDRVWALLLLVAGTQFMKHTGAWASTPYTIVLEVCVLAQTAVLPAQRAVIQCYYRKKKDNTDKLTRRCTTTFTRTIRPIIHPDRQNIPFSVLSIIFSVYLSLIWNRMLVSCALSYKNCRKQYKAERTSYMLLKVSFIRHI